MTAINGTASPSCPSQVKSWQRLSANESSVRFSAVDQQLRQEKAGFRRGKGCADQLFTLRNIIEQCTECQRQLYINFVDFQKAFDSVDRDSLWHILRAYDVPQKIVKLIQSFYEAVSCSVENSDISFKVKTGVKQGCVMSSLLLASLLE